MEITNRCMFGNPLRAPQNVARTFYAKSLPPAFLNYFQQSWNKNRCTRLLQCRGISFGRAQVGITGQASITKTSDDSKEEEDNDEEVVQVEHLEKQAKSIASAYSLSMYRKLDSEIAEKELGNQRTRKRQRNFKRLIKQVPDYLLPKVVIVGRPNVGKSALFNRFVGRNVAIVADEPGVTRDRLYGRSFWKEREFIVVDTGGVVNIADSQRIGIDALAITRSRGEERFELATKDTKSAGLPSMIEKQAIAAVNEASVIIFVVDGQAGVTAGDTEIADWLRKNHSDKHIVLAVNKCESPRKGLLQASEFWTFGLVPLPISAIAGTGIQELRDIVCSQMQLPELMEERIDADENVLAIAIVGKPNVGKSSIINALLKEERTIVSPISGTTRDAIDTDYTGPNGKVYRLIDTAGIRRRVAVAASGSMSESLSVNRAFRAIRRADVVALVIEAMTCVTEQDYKIAERIELEGKGCIIVVNKWDTIPDKNNKTTLFYEQDVREKLRILSWAPIVYVSATSDDKLDKVIRTAELAFVERSKRLGTSILNQVVQESLAFKPPPTSGSGKRGRIYYCTQAAIRPPTFVFFVNDAKLFPEPYRRYMEKQLRSNIGFPGTPIRLLWRNRRKEEKYSKDKTFATSMPSLA